MEILLLVVALLLGFAVVAHFLGRPRFWKLTRKYPEEALEMFRSEECWQVFTSKPLEGYAAHLPGDQWNWVGPFNVYEPISRRLISVYGRSVDMEESQRRFVARLGGK